MNFEEWSNRRKEQKDFELWSNERKNRVQAVKPNFSAPYVGAGERADRRLRRKKGGERVAATWDLGESEAIEQNPLVATVERAPISVEVPSNRLSQIGIEPTVYKLTESPLAQAGTSAYTNNWNLAVIDDKTLSQLIGDYSNYWRNRDLSQSGEKRYDGYALDKPTFDTLYGLALDMAYRMPIEELREIVGDNGALPPDDPDQAAGHTTAFPPTVSFPNYFGKAWGFPDRKDNPAKADNSGDSAEGTEDGRSKEISIDLGIKQCNQHDLVGIPIGSQDAGDMGCVSVAIAMALGITPKDFIENLNANGGYNSNNLLNWRKVEELYAYNFENKSGKFEDTKDSILEYLEAGIPVIGQIRRSDGGYHYFLITGFDGDVGRNENGSYDLSNVTMDMFMVNDPNDGSSKTLTQAVGASNFNAIAAYIPPKAPKGAMGR